MNGAKYFDLESTLDRYSDSPAALVFLQGVIDRSSPDAFHQADIERAEELALADPESEYYQGDEDPEDDGQPSEYEEWQDVYGGDDCYSPYGDE